MFGDCSGSFTTMKVVLFLIFGFVCANAYQSFQNSLPNGDLVPHPCKPNYLWKGVGHFNVLGGGARNPFGKDFSRLGRTWNRELCETDSDGDGKSNGEELGDPDCIWTPQGGAPSSVAKGHPGVCEPVDALVCRAGNAAAKADWNFCEEGEFKCDAIKEPDVKNFTIAIDAGTPVPAKETTYMCQLVKLPDDQKYHIIGTKPALDNKVVAHHIIVYGCDETALDAINHYSSPQPCDAMEINNACGYGVGGWTVGEAGYCDLPDVGTLFGKRVFNYAVIEIHWNNPMEVPDYTDGSGLTMFYTPKLRKYDAGVITIGQMGLAIPPNVQTHYQTAYCPKECTEQIERPLYIYTANLHMHYLGRGGRVEHWSKGSLANVLVDEMSYSYDSPVLYKFDPPIVFHSGDELKMNCKFKSTSKNGTTYYGDATSDEMCFGFINYYPRTNFDDCINYGSVFSCEKPDKTSDDVLIDSARRQGCNMDDFENLIIPISTRLAEVCGSPNPVCNKNCSQYLEATYEKEPCFRNGLRFYFEMLMNGPFRGEGTDALMELLRVCDKEIIRANTVPKYYDGEFDEVVAGASSTPVGNILSPIMTVMILFMQL